MKRLCVLGLFVIFSFFSSAESQVIFNGQDLAGWSVQGNSPAHWTVENGAIMVSQQAPGRGWLRFGHEIWRDFKLSLEWKAEKSANSGVLFHIPAGDDVDPTWQGLEIQICDDDNYSLFYHQGDRRELSGAIYGVVAPSHAMYAGAEQWNHYELTVQGAHVQLVYNGQRVLDTELTRYHTPFEMWKQMRAPLSARPRAGFIGLQAHKGAKVWFKNITLEKLSPKSNH